MTKYQSNSVIYYHISRRFAAHLQKYLPSVFCLPESSFMECCIKSKSHISHQLIDAISCRFWQLYFVCFIILSLLAYNLSLCQSIESLFWKLNLWPKRIVFYCFVDSLLVDLLEFLLMFSFLDFFFNFLPFNRLSLLNFWLVLHYLLFLL